MKKKLLFFGLTVLCFGQIQSQVLTGTFVGRYATGLFDVGSTEIAAYDATSKKLFSVNGSTGKIDVIDFSNPTAPVLLSTLDLSPYGAAANSVAVHNGIVACAVEAIVKQDAGKVVFFNTAGTFLKSIDAGALPDMITFSLDGNLVITANEGEPSADYTNDPEGSITVIDISSGVASAVATQIDFKAYIGSENNLRSQGIRIFGLGANAAQDMEPEYVTVSDNSKTAWVVCQENNAMVEVNLSNKTITSIKALGFKDHSIKGNGIDASDRNNGTINITTNPIKGLYMPDGLANLKYNGKTYILSANEGDAREYTANLDKTKQLKEEVVVSSLSLDPTIFPNSATLKLANNLGRLNVTNMLGDTDKDGDFDELYSFGARSFSIWDSTMTQVYDSGDQIEQYIATNYPAYFGVSSTNNTKQNRSDNKGPEPESVITGKIGGKTYAFVGLERFGGIMVYDVTNPLNVTFESYMTSRDFLTTPGANTAGGDLAPEGLLFISAANSPTGKPYILSSNETSGSIAVYELGGSIVTSDEELALVQSSSLSVYPNPNNGTVLFFNKNSSGRIYNSNGLLVNTFVNVNEVNIQNLNSGLYFISTDHNENVKFIVE